MTEEYPGFAKNMSRYPEYSWEGIKVTTDDKYILTLFHVWREDALDDSKGPVMF